jgi:hypothetical protein
MFRVVSLLLALHVCTLSLVLAAQFPELLSTQSLAPDTDSWVYAAPSPVGGIFLSGGQVYVAESLNSKLVIEESYTDTFDANVAVLVGNATILFVSSPDPEHLTLSAYPSFRTQAELQLPDFEEVPEWVAFVPDTRGYANNTCYLVGHQYVVALHVTSHSIHLLGTFTLPLDKARVDVDRVSSAAYSFGISPPQLWISLYNADSPDDAGAILTLALNATGGLTSSYSFTYLQQGPRNSFVLQPPGDPLQIVWQQADNDTNALVFVWNTVSATYRVVSVPMRHGEKWGLGSISDDRTSVVGLVSGPIDSSMLQGFAVHSVDTAGGGLIGSLDVNSHAMPSVGAPLPDPSLSSELTGALASGTMAGNMLMLFSLGPLRQCPAPVRHRTPIASIAAGGVADPPTCQVSPCGPTRGCSDTSLSCCEYMKQMFCCEVPPY